jgi:hypothetical protein
VLNLLRPGSCHRPTWCTPNADITKAEQAAEIIVLADYWNNAAGSDPGLLVSGS